MSQQKLLMCQLIEHIGEDIQGFCFNLSCQYLRSQFCLQCGIDPMKNLKKDLKGFGQVQSFVTKFNKSICELTNQLNESFGQIKIKYEESSKQLENMKKQLFKLSECKSQQDYQQMKDNLQLIKECMKYLIIENIKRMIHAFDLDKQFQQQIPIIEQGNQSLLQEGIQLLNQYKLQEAQDLMSQYLKQWKKNIICQNPFYVFLQLKRSARKRQNNERLGQRDQ
ncbi:unnamed protein product [Paramecium pentaurelia]|uniref:Uncharacterized protein n=1 Tax=Paramecium pentaurelia TaxID=43138 RepID=A0A8S1XZD2_9CILI|nr:unnamed protein product [Paramecium pentaurelia]